MIIDFHTHTFPDKLAAAATKKLSEMGHIPARLSGTADALKASMQRAGIDISVVLPVATNPLKLRSMNDFSIASNKGEGLIYFGAVHPDAPDWYEELGRIAEQGIKGIKLHPVYQGVDINDPRYLRILNRAGELNLTVVTHAGDDIGFPGEVRCSPKMTADALRQVGSVRLVLAHMGGWKNWERVADTLLNTSAILDTAYSLGRITALDNAYDEEFLPLLSNDDFVKLVRAFGSDRVLFGTDSPWADQLETLNGLLALPLSDEEKQNILCTNAQKLLF